MQIYGELAHDWYRLLDPLEDHEYEASLYSDLLTQAVSGPARTLLELGSGAGNNAYYMKQRFASTLADRSVAMHALSQQVNPECQHVSGDMRSLRLGTLFDAVFVHDAIMYITSKADLHAVASTAFLHTRPGGAALFAPDWVKETFREQAELHGGDVAGRSLRCMEWAWDPDPADDTVIVDYVLVLREAGASRVHHDQHLEGLFSRDIWLQILTEAGFTPDIETWTDEGQVLEVFVCKRPGGA